VELSTAVQRSAAAAAAAADSGTARYFATADREVEAQFMFISLFQV